jgi:hypothetical protein
MHFIFIIYSHIKYYIYLIYIYAKIAIDLIKIKNFKFIIKNTTINIQFLNKKLIFLYTY